MEELPLPVTEDFITDEEVRLKCLELAIEYMKIRGNMTGDALQLAQYFYEYVKKKPND